MQQKRKWTTDDFNDIGWHDSRVYSMQFPEEDLKLRFHLDYITEWHLNAEGLYDLTWTKCSLVFNGVSNLSVNLMFSDYIGIYIKSMNREQIRLIDTSGLDDYHYTILTDVGEIGFDSTGFSLDEL